MPDLAEFGNSLDGELFSPDSPGYEAIRRPVNLAYREVRPRLVVRCRSVSDVVGAMTYATASGDRIAPRGGGHCFGGRSSTDGIVLDMSGLDGISVTADRVATIRAGARLGQAYAALHAYGRTLPAGCGPTVGITGLTQFGEPRTMGRRQLTFTAMGGACNRVVEDATAFAHRSERFLLEHIADAADPWVDRSWATAHADGSRRVYPSHLINGEGAPYPRGQERVVVVIEPERQAVGVG